MSVDDVEAVPYENPEVRVGGYVDHNRSSVSDLWRAPGPPEMFTGAQDELLVVHNTFLEHCNIVDLHTVNADRFVSAPASLGGISLPIINGQTIDSAKKENHANPPTKSCTDLETTKMTTVMMRNIPSRTSASALLDLIVATFGRSLESLVDFVYLPIDFKTNKNLGYCFINFTEATDAAELIKHLNGLKYLFSETSEKQLQISYSNRQGYSNNLEVFTQTKMLDTWPLVFRPLAKVNGALVPVSSELLAQIVGDVNDH